MFPSCSGSGTKDTGPKSCDRPSTCRRMARRSPPTTGASTRAVEGGLGRPGCGSGLVAYEKLNGRRLGDRKSLFLNCVQDRDFDLVRRFQERRGAPVIHGRNYQMKGSDYAR